MARESVVCYYCVYLYLFDNILELQGQLAQCHAKLQRCNETLSQQESKLKTCNEELSRSKACMKHSERLIRKFEKWFEDEKCSRKKLIAVNGHLIAAYKTLLTENKEIKRLHNTRAYICVFMYSLCGVVGTCSFISVYQQTSHHILAAIAVK